ncbi:MAG: hypothetical protein R3C53_10580 [Pirellulaceae bacterium]
MENPINPYAATPASVDASDPAFAHYPQIGEAAMVNQVMVVGILQIVLGCMELMMAGTLFFGSFVIQYGAFSQGPAPGPPPEALYVMLAYYWIVGGLVLVFSIMRIASGIGCFRFRGRTWMIVSLIGGTVSVLTCYCLPFTIGVCIYGCIVMFNSGVAKAFRMGREGVPAAEIKNRFMMVG